MFERLPPPLRVMLPAATMASMTGLALGGCEPADDAKDATAEVFVDAAGVPHIYAPDDVSLLWAAGYVQAETRLTQMELVRRRALGTQAALLGPDKVDEDELSRIFNFRDLGARDMARLERESPEDFALVEAWVAGVNAHLAEVRAGDVARPVGLGPTGLDHLPRDWTADDVGAIAKLLMFGNSNSLEYEVLTTVLTRLDPDLFDQLQIARPAYPVFTLPPADRPGSDAKLGAGSGQRLSDPRRALPPTTVSPDQTVAGLKKLHETLEEFSVIGSNNWAVAGEHTSTGRPLIANDPHQPLTSPAIVFAQHLNSKDGGGSFDAVGFGFVGTPGVQLGHSRDVAWAATTGSADAMDLWSVSVDESSETVTVGGTAAPYAARTETIEVRDAASRSLEVLDVDGYGVILGDALLLDLGIDESFIAGDGRRLLVNWTGFEHGNEVRAFFDMARAEDADGFEAAAERMEVGTFNWVFADADDIGYRSRILVPDRGDLAGRAVPFVMLDGDDDTSLWDGAFLDDAVLPRSRNPQQGFLLSANNDPLGFSVDGDLRNDPYYFGTFFFPGFRAKRADDELRRLVDAGEVTRTATQSLQMDNYVTEADLVLPVLFAAFERVGQDPDLAEFEGRPELEAIVTALRDWNREMNADAHEAVLFHVFAHELARSSVGDELSLAFEAVINVAPAFPLKFSALAVSGGYPEAAALLDDGLDRTLLEALDATAAHVDTAWPDRSIDALRWADVHVSRFASPVAELTWGEVGTAGSVGTLNQSVSAYLDEDGAAASLFVSKHGPMFRSVVEFDEAGDPHMWFNFAPGNGGSPASSHWGDLIEDWVAGVYLPMPFDREAVQAASGERRTLPLPQFD